VHAIVKDVVYLRPEKSIPLISAIPLGILILPSCIIPVLAQTVSSVAAAAPITIDGVETGNE